MPKFDDRGEKQQRHVRAGIDATKEYVERRTRRVATQAAPTMGVPAAHAPRSRAALVPIDLDTDRPYRDVTNAVTAEVTLHGDTPLLFHFDDPMAADALKVERKRISDAMKKGAVEKEPTAGDDRFPAWTWMTYCYINPDDGVLCVPGENMMAMLRDAGSMIKGPGKSTMKRISQSAFVPDDYFRLEGPMGEIPITMFEELKNLKFSEQAQAVRDFGFDLFVKRANVNGKKHLRVRPMFKAWRVTGRFQIIDPETSIDSLYDVLDAAGFRTGIGDWRPKSPQSPGRYGRFTPSVREIKAKGR